MASAIRLNYFWQRVLLESSIMNVHCFNKLEANVAVLISKYMDCTLKLASFDD